MVTELYVGRGARKGGPYSPTQLRAFAASGRLHPTDTIWKEGMGRAVPASEVKNLFPAPAADPSAPPEMDTVTAPVPHDPIEVSVQIGPLVPLDPPAAVAPKATPTAARKRRAVAVKGAILLSQDGATVSYRKKCVKCAFEDPARTTMRIGQGVSRINFYCPKCRKGQEVLIQGVMS